MDQGEGVTIPREIVCALTVCALVVTLRADLARAQAGGEPTPGTGEKSAETRGRIEEITVRARKVEELEQSTPVAVTPFSEATLERQVSYDLRDLKGAPNVLLDSVGAFPNATAFSIRGGSFQDIETSFEPAVGVIQDGIYVGRNATSLLNLYDTESVEILRGPQGVLFGRNSASGMVVARSRRPSGNFGTRGVVSLGDRGLRDYRFAVDVPIVPEKVAGTAAFFSQQSDGHFPNAAPPGNGGRLGDVNLWSMRGILQFTPTDSFELTVIADFLKDRSGAAGLNNSSQPGTLFALVGFPAEGGSLFSVNQNMHERSHTDLSDLIAELSWDIGPVRLTSISGWRSTKEDIWSDFDAEPVVLFETRRPQSVGQFSEEIRLAGDVVPDVLNFTLGWYHYANHYSLSQTTALDVCTFVVIPGGGACTPATLGALDTFTNARQTLHSNGYFGQLIWSVTDAVRISAGGRWTVDDKSFTISPPNPVANAERARADDRWHRFTPRIGMDFTLTDDLFVYAHYASGFRSGGFNGRAGTISPASVGPYDSEMRNSSEAGIKSQWLDDRLRVNLTGFYDRFHDMQLPVVVPTGIPTSPQETVTRNAAVATIWGLELESIVKPLDAITLWASAAYLHAKYADFLADLDGDGVANDNTDLDLIRAPRYTGHLEAMYSLELPDAGSVDLVAGWTYVSHYSTEARNVPIANVPATSLYDASVTYRPMDSAWRFTVYGKNLFDRNVVGGGLDVAGLFSFNAPIPPRTYGVQVGWEYDDLGELFQ